MGRQVPETFVPRERFGAVAAPRPTDLTPTDTSSTVPPALAAALRRYHADVDEVVVEPEPNAASIAVLRARAAADHVVVGTIDAHRLTAQLRLVEALAATGRPTIAVAMRGPWDVAGYPAGIATLATYSGLPGSLDALAAVVTGEATAPGRIPVRLPVPA
jgi:beta-N-acetylhexosaminidase